MKRFVPGAWRAWASRRVLRPIRAAREARASDAALLHPPPATVEVEGWPADVAPALVGTGVGLLMLSGGVAYPLLRGWVFGITRLGDEWVVFQRTGEYGRLLALRLEGTRLAAVRTIVSGLWGTVHQIDVIDGRLCVTDPRENRIAIYEPDGRMSASILPLGALDDGRASVNYGHLNSVSARGDRITLVAHNYTQVSGRRSEFLVLRRADWRLIERVPDIGSSAHNYVEAAGLRLWCDSGAGTLVNDGTSAFSAGLFTRGLAFDGIHVLVGASQYGARAERVGKDGFVHALDASLRHRATVRLKEWGPVFELRFVAGDEGMSG